MATARQRQQVEQFVTQYAIRMGREASNLSNFVLKHIANGIPVEKAISLAFKESAFFSINQSATVEAVVKAAYAGAGVSIDNNTNMKNVELKLLNESWTPDKMPLSKRLHGIQPVMRQNIIDATTAAMRQGKSVIDIARELYDGYNSGKVINRADLPAYLSRLQQAARKAVDGDHSVLRDFNKALAAAEYQIRRNSKGDTPTKALKAGYTMLLDAAKDLDKKALEHSVRVAIEERSRYYAERIARTEVARAYAEGFISRIQADNDVVAVRWMLSSRHSQVPFDICDMNANADMYGLGKGVYPKGKMPPLPAHVHCMCSLIEIYNGEVEQPEKAKFDYASVDKYLKSLPEKKQKALLGVAGRERWLNGGDWQSILRNWEEHRIIKTRISLDDFSLQRFSKNQEPIYGLIKAENVYGAESKLISYSLNKGHPKGRDKAIAFEKALGYTVDNWKELQEKIHEALSKHPAISAGKTPITNNNKYIVNMVIEGVNGKTATILTIWEQVGERFRMVNSYVVKRKTI